MSLFTTVLLWLAAFAGCILFGYLVANFLTKGFVWGMTKARLFSQVLVKIHTVSKPYYRVGKIIVSANGSSFLKYTPRNNVAPGGQKVDKMLVIKKGSIQNNLGVDYVEVDEETNNVLSLIDWKVVSGHDAESTDALYKRTAMLPKDLSQKEMIIIILLVLVLLIVGYTAFKTGSLQKSIDSLQLMINATRTIPANVGNLPA